MKTTNKEPCNTESDMIKYSVKKESDRIKAEIYEIKKLLQRALISVSKYDKR